MAGFGVASGKAFHIGDKILIMKVEVKITPSISSAVDSKCHDWLTLEREVQEEATVCDVLKDLAATYPTFGRMLFVGETTSMSDEIDIVLNYNILETPKAAATKLKNGDTLIILPLYEGG